MEIQHKKNKGMKNYFLLFPLLFVCCSPLFVGENEFGESKFLQIVESYVRQYSAIPNKCNSKPYYKVYFRESKDSVGFWVVAHLGRPGIAEPPPPPGSSSSSNPMEIKGVMYIKDKPIVFYDYKNSDGYGLYDVLKLKKIQVGEFDSIPDSCSHVWYPEAWFFTVNKDSIFLTDKREPFILK